MAEDDIRPIHCTKPINHGSWQQDWPIKHQCFRSDFHWRWRLEVETLKWCVCDRVHSELDKCEDGG